MKLSKSSLKLVLRDPGFSDQLTDMIMQRLGPTSAEDAIVDQDTVVPKTEQRPPATSAQASSASTMVQGASTGVRTDADDDLMITPKKMRLLKAIRTYARAQRTAPWRKIDSMGDQQILDITGGSWTINGAVKKIETYLDFQ